MLLIDDIDSAPSIRSARYLARAGRAAEAPHILLADDDEDIRDLVATTLRLSGYTVDTTDDGPTALALIDSRRPDLVLLDVVMPGISGFEICRRLREQRAVPPPPVILLSGKTAPAAVRAGLEAGAARYHRKPVDLEGLLHDIRSVL